MLTANPSTFTSTLAEAPYMTGGARAVSDDAVNLFVNYLPLTVDDAHLLQRFAAHGRVLSAKIMRHICADAPRDAALGTDSAPVQKSKGYGFVLMASRDEARSAMEALNGDRWDNKRLVVQVAQRLPADANVPERTQPDAPPVPGRPHAAAAAPKAAPVVSMPLHLRADVAAPATAFAVVVAPLDARCTVTHLAAVLEAYGPVIGAEILPGGSSARVSFASEASATDAVRWLHGARVPQIAARNILQVSLDSSANAARQESPGRRRAPRRSELIPNAATLRVNDRTMPPPLHHPTPSLDKPTCDHGPYCQCGANTLSALRSLQKPAASRPQPAVRSTARAQLGARHHDPYHRQPLPSYDAFSSGPRDQGPASNSRRQHTDYHDGAASSGYDRPAPAHHHPMPPPPPASAFVSTRACVDGCAYCNNCTTVILQNMPFEDAQCEQALNTLLGPIGYFRFWECWGDGQAVAVFADYACAAEAVELLGGTDQQVDFYDCEAGLPLSRVEQSGRHY